MAQGKKTGGRKPGTRNRKNAALIAAVEASGLTPLAYMLSVIRDRDADAKRRDAMAAAAAPYIHPKLSTVELGGKDGGPIPLSVIERRIISGKNAHN